MEEAKREQLRSGRIDRRREIVERQSEPTKRRLAIALIVVAVLAISGIVIAGYVVKYVIPPRQAIVTVNEVSFTRADMIKRLRAQQSGAELFGLDFKMSEEIFGALHTMVENEIMVQTSARYGLAVSEEEIDRWIQALFLPRVSDLLTTDAAQINSEFKESYRAYLNATQLSESEHRDLARSSIVRAKFQEFIGERVPNVAEQIRYYQLVLNHIDEIDIIQTKYNDATASALTAEEFKLAFKEVVREFSRDDPETVRLGGEKGWLPRGVLPAYEDMLYALEVGKLSTPQQDVDDPTLVIFYMVPERAEARELDPENREVLKREALQEWLNEERDNHVVNAEFDSEIYDWLVAQLRISSKATPDPTPDSLPIPGGLTLN